MDFHIQETPTGKIRANFLAQILTVNSFANRNFSLSNQIVSIFFDNGTGKL